MLKARAIIDILERGADGIHFRILLAHFRREIHTHKIKLVQEPDSLAEKILGREATIGEALSRHCAQNENERRHSNHCKNGQ